MIFGIDMRYEGNVSSELRHISSRHAAAADMKHDGRHDTRHEAQSHQLAESIYTTEPPYNIAIDLHMTIVWGHYTFKSMYHIIYSI